MTPVSLLHGDAAVHRVAAGLQFTLPGVPMVFAGDEIGLEGVIGEDSRRTMPWHRAEEWDRATLAAYAALARVRREHADTSALVVARRAAGDGFSLGSE